MGGLECGSKSGLELVQGACCDYRVREMVPLRDGPGEECGFSVFLCAWGDVVCLGVVLASAMAALGGGWCVFGLDVDEVVVVFVEGFESCLFPTLLEGGPC